MTRTWKQAILGELQPLYKNRGIREKPDIWILRSELSILAKLKEGLDKARDECALSYPSKLSGEM